MKGFETGIEKCARIYTQNTGCKVVWGDKCMTDGKGTIWLPTLSDSTDPRILTRTRLNMGHEVSHVLHSDFSAITKAIETGGMSKKTILNSLDHTVPAYTASQGPCYFMASYELKYSVPARILSFSLTPVP